MPHLYLWTSVILGALAQIFLKMGVNKNTSGAPRVKRAVWIGLWLGSFVIASALWLAALSQMKVSYAFPILGAGYPIVTLLSVFILRERISPAHWAAIAVITAGVVLIVR